MSEKMLTPQQAADKSGELLAQDNYNSDGYNSAHEEATLLAKEFDKVAIAGDYVKGTGEKATAEDFARRDEVKVQIQNAGGKAYWAKHLQETAATESKEFASNHASELHDAAVAMAALDGYQYNSVDKSGAKQTPESTETK